MNIISAIIAALALIGAIGGGIYLVEDRYAHRVEHELLAGTFRDFALEQRIENRRRRLWTIQEKFGENCGPLRSICEELRTEIAALERRLRQR